MKFDKMCINGNEFKTFTCVLLITEIVLVLVSGIDGVVTNFPVTALNGFTYFQ